MPQACGKSALNASVAGGLLWTPVKLLAQQSGGKEFRQDEEQVFSLDAEFGMLVEWLPSHNSNIKPRPATSRTL